MAEVKDGNRQQGLIDANSMMNFNSDSPPVHVRQTDQTYKQYDKLQFLQYICYLLTKYCLIADEESHCGFEIDPNNKSEILTSIKDLGYFRAATSPCHNE